MQASSVPVSRWNPILSYPILTMYYLLLTTYYTVDHLLLTFTHAVFRYLAPTFLFPGLRLYLYRLCRTTPPLLLSPRPQVPLHLHTGIRISHSRLT